MFNSPLDSILTMNLVKRIKLCDFGATTRQGSLVHRTNNTWTAFLPPEVLEVLRNERYVVKASSDVWQFGACFRILWLSSRWQRVVSGIILYLCLTGTSPWLKADWVSDTKYCAFMKYQVKWLILSFKSCGEVMWVWRSGRFVDPKIFVIQGNVHEMRQSK